MPKKKLQRFAEMETFANVIQPGFDEVFGKDYPLKGRWKQEHFRNNHPLILELGCGKGEYTTGLARLNPEKNFIGVDIKGSRIWRGALTALGQKLDNVAFLRTHIELIGSFFGPGEVDEIWLTFPDPQLKKKRKRLTSSGFLNRYRKFTGPDSLVHLKTDNAVLYEYTRDLVRHNGLFICVQTDDLYGSGLDRELPDIKTFYERQFLSKGMPIHYLSFVMSHEKVIEEPSTDPF